METLKEERKKLCKTQVEVAEEIGISAIMYSYIEQGRRRPSDKIKVKLSNYYNKPIDYLFFNNSITQSNNNSKQTEQK